MKNCPTCGHIKNHFGGCANPFHFSKKEIASIEKNRSYFQSGFQLGNKKLQIGNKERELPNEVECIKCKKKDWIQNYICEDCFRGDNIKSFEKLEIIEIDISAGGGVYWLMDSERCGYHQSETYQNYEDAMNALKSGKIIWEVNEKA